MQLRGEEVGTLHQLESRGSNYSRPLHRGVLAALICTQIQDRRVDPWQKGESEAPQPFPVPLK